MLYRITYNGIGIYEAFKKICSTEEWKEIKKVSGWLPLPKAYENDDKKDYSRSYFTLKGYEKFNKTVLPFIVKKIKSDNINVEEISDNNLGTPIYEDEYQKVYDISNNNINEQIENINEVYFGKTPEIKAIEDQLDKFRKSYIGQSKLPKNDPNLNKLIKMIGQIFGIRFALNIIFDPVPMANSVPIAKDLKKDSIVVDPNTYRFKPEAGFICIVNMSSGLIFSSDFTTEEIMAAILYELGFLFMVCFTDSNITLYNIYSILQFVNVIASILVQIYQIHYHIKPDMSAELDKKVLPQVDTNFVKNLIDKNHLSTEEEKIAFINKLKENPNLKLYLDAINTKKRLISNSVDYTGLVLDTAAIQELQNLKSYQKAVSYSKERIRTNNSIKSTCIRFVDYISLSFKYVIGAFTGICIRILNKLNLGKTPSNIIQWLCIDDLILPYASTIMKAKNPINWINMPLQYKVEQAASNFPTMYGYGAAETSYFAKMDSNNRITLIKYILKKVPFIGAIYDVCMIPAKILNGIFDSKQSGINRCVDQINLLKNELIKQDIDSETKSIIQKDINECLSELNKLTQRYKRS